MARHKFPTRCLLLLGICLGSVSVFAQETEENSGDPIYESRQLYYKSDRGLDAEALLGEEQLRMYREALEVDDCDLAYAPLANAYAVAYPEEPFPGTILYSHIDWIIYVSYENFPELAFCLAMRELREARAAIIREGIEFERFNTEYYSGLGVDIRPISDLVNAFRGFFRLATRGYPPVYLALVRLSDEGDILRFTKEFQYYMVLQARNLGTDTAELREMTARAAARLDTGTIVELERQVANGEFTYSNDWLE